MAQLLSVNINLFTIGGSLAFMAHLSWRLTPIAVTHLVALSSVCHDLLSKKAQDRLAEATQSAEEVIGSMRTVRSFACEKRESEGGMRRSWPGFWR